MFYDILHMGLDMTDLFQLKDMGKMDVSFTGHVSCKVAEKIIIYECSHHRHPQTDNSCHIPRSFPVFCSVCSQFMLPAWKSHEQGTATLKARSRLI